MKKPSWDNSFWKHLHPLRLQPEFIGFTYTFCLGGCTFLLFSLLVMSGLLLTFYYLPLTDKAYPSITEITYLVPYGGLIRNIHYWSGQLMVLSLLLHMVRVFYHRAYRPPRQFNWLVGLALLVLTFGEDFSGYVLRWDGDTHSAALVAVNLVREIPWVGPFFHLLLVGGDQIGETTILRFYILHCMLLPGLILFLIFYHFWRVRKDGLAGRPL
jgi:quinol-cytochrome oxidoreductase complex cytochrome b subunit